MAEIDKVSKPASASWNALLTNRAEDQTEVEFALTSWLPGHIGKNTQCIRPGTPLSLEEAKRLIQQYVDRYNNLRLHRAIGYVTPNDMLAGRQAKDPC
ncbi:MAG: transposase [Acidobacteria bacterium]|nr:transposase [Acidobacteriota bacterium]